MTGKEIAKTTDQSGPLDHLDRCLSPVAHHEEIVMISRVIKRIISENEITGDDPQSGESQ